MELVIWLTNIASSLLHVLRMKLGVQANLTNGELSGTATAVGLPLPSNVCAAADLVFAAYHACNRFGVSQVFFGEDPLGERMFVV